MKTHLIFDFKTDVSKIKKPGQLNNPFGTEIPEIAQIATLEFQDFIKTNSSNWEYDFSTKKGKMFGVLVVQKESGSYHYLATVSGKYPSTEICKQLTPSIFNVASDDFFINKGMFDLIGISNQINQSTNETEINLLKAKRKQKSHDLQQQLFENYRVINALGQSKNIVEIFEGSSDGISTHKPNPPSGAGECAAPKLLQHAFSNGLKPVAIAEFWWGNPPKNQQKSHKSFYPACKDKCRPILEFMLNDFQLFRKHTRK